jgi:iron complex transport system substrate-binding protein
MFKIFILLGFILVAGAGCRSGDDVSGTDSSEIRIVSLAPNITEAVCAVGAADLLVGRTSACNYPPQVMDTVPVIGGFGVPSLEMLAKVRPTLVFDCDLADESVGLRIDAMGLRRQRIASSTLDDIPGMLREIGSLTGHEAEGNALADRISSRLTELRRKSKEGHIPRVYAEIWHDPMTTTGSGTFLSDLIALAGGVNIGNAAKRDYFQISAESVISAEPEVILCLYMEEQAGAAEAVKKRPGWQHLAAVRNGDVYDRLNNDVLLRPGPRVLEGVEMLKKCFEKAKHSVE